MSDLLQDAYGAIFAGATVSYALYGIALAQFVVFCQKIDQSEWTVNGLVIFTWAMDTLQQILITHALWYYLVWKSGGSAIDRYNVNWSLQGQGIPSVILTLTVQWFFIIRLWKFSGQRWTIILFVPVVTAFVLSFAWSVRSLVKPAPLVYVLDRNTKIVDVTTTAILETANISCLVADIGISAILCYQLHKHRSDALGGSKGVVDTLIRYTVTTGLLSSIITLLSLILYVGNAGVTFAGLLAAYFVHAKIYVNCMLASLNNRERLRARVSQVIEADLEGPRPLSMKPASTDMNMSMRPSMHETTQRPPNILHIAPGATDGMELPAPVPREVLRGRSPFDSWPLIQ